MSTDYRDYDDTGAVLVNGAIQPQPGHPFIGTDRDPARKSFQERILEKACLELWPPHGQPPTDMWVRDRNGLIWGWYRAKGIREEFFAGERTLRRFFNGA